MSWGEYERGMPSIIRWGEGSENHPKKKIGFKMSVEAILMHFGALFFFLKPSY